MLRPLEGRAGVNAPGPLEETHLFLRYFNLFSLSYIDMTDYSWEQFAEIFDLPKLNILGSTTDKYQCYLELTLNFPRTSRFRRLIYSSQVLVYKNLLDYIKSSNPWIKNIDSFIENSADGSPHLHAMVSCEFTQPYSSEGVIMDFVNSYYSQLPKRSQLHQYRYHYNHFLDQFKSPPICINYKEHNASAWNSYIRKNIL